MANTDTPQTIYLKDYKQPAYLIDTVNLRFELGETETRVVSEMEIYRNEAVNESRPVLELQGEHLHLGTIMLNEHALGNGQFVVSKDKLLIPGVPDRFTLQIETFIKPQENTSLEGLYKSSGNFCTQCEAEGFRKITYYLDRPDVMARFTTTVVADKAKYPVLLSNGNPVDSGELDHGRHFVTWQDPFRKPSYLFALVAGDLACIEDTFITVSGRKIALRIYVEKHNVDKCDHAMHSLKKAMAWDEQRYGREYDLDIYMIVAVDDFNMGAMENKGLNVFNSKFVLAKPQTATDVDFINVEGVIGHEYFHNWTGNRITCRDWFQLTLKEGLTVFRDQQFTADMTSAAVKRIDDVNVLRTRQFDEDAGPMSHPIQPDQYVEINNFYTSTVYNKGAEVIRMIHTLLGEQGFRAGMDLYFERHDGQAVTTEDFVKAMEDATGRNLKQFRRWYHQSGTPEVHVTGEYMADKNVYRMTLRQSSHPDNRPFHIPVSVGLLSANGEEIADTVRVIELTQPEQKIDFENVRGPVVPSVLRNFSAPVKLDIALGDEELAFLMAHDSDSFIRWNAAQQLGVNIMTRMMDDARHGKQPMLPQVYIEAMRRVLTSKNLDKALQARILMLPEEEYVSGLLPRNEVDAVHAAREACRTQLAQGLQTEMLAAYSGNQAKEYRLDAGAMGQRSLKNICLNYLANLNRDEYRKLALDQYMQAGNMTDQFSALRALVHIECDERAEVLERFYQQWQADPLVIDKWFTVQATASLPSTLTQVEALIKHKAFDIRVPNRVRALVGAFSQANPVCFHDISGRGYVFLANIVMHLNAINPQIAARLVLPLIQWRRHDASRQRLMKSQLEHIAALPELARDVYEVVSRGLQA
jgi:aminopeptidase N